MGAFAIILRGHAYHSADFLLLKALNMHDFPKNILQEIRKHCLSNREIESCGVVFLYDDYSFLPMKNELLSSGAFSIDPKIYFFRKKVAAVVHSHPLCDAAPSDADKKCSEALGLPFLIYSCLYDNFVHLTEGRCIPIKE